MRVAVSDFDGTLKIGHSVSLENINAIRGWREEGNVFGIATGRDLSLIRHEINYWGIPFDFLICLNGTVLYDRNLNVLKSETIPDDIVKPLILHPSALESFHNQLCINGLNKLYFRNRKSYFTNMDLIYQEITLEESLQEKGVQQISFEYETEEIQSRCAEALIKTFEGQVSVHSNRQFIDINPYKVDKLAGILDILAVLGWSAKDLLVIGDGENDIPMIRHFQGFSVSDASIKAIDEASLIYSSVGDMLMDNF